MHQPIDQAGKDHANKDYEFADGNSTGTPAPDTNARGSTGSTNSDRRNGGSSSQRYTNRNSFMSMLESHPYVALAAVGTTAVAVAFVLKNRHRSQPSSIRSVRGLTNEMRRLERRLEKGVRSTINDDMPRVIGAAEHLLSKVDPRLLADYSPRLSKFIDRTWSRFAS